MQAPRKPKLIDFDKFAKSLAEKAQDIAERKVKDFAQDQCVDFVSRIESQNFESFEAIPLSAYTKHLKKLYLRSQKTMISTHTYLNSIQVHSNARWCTPKGVQKQIVIGIDPSIPARDIQGNVRKGVSLNFVARWQEYGTSSGIPARPHWGPFLAIIKKRAKALRKSLASEIVAEGIKILKGSRK